MASDPEQPLLSQGGTSFVYKLYDMLNDPQLARLIYWMGDDDRGTFAIDPSLQFAEALQRYFKHNNLSSFVRQLHMYGFHKVSHSHSTKHRPKDELWAFRHSSGLFKRNDKASLSLIKRRQPASSTSASVKNHKHQHEAAALEDSYEEERDHYQFQQQYHPQYQVRVPAYQYPSSSASASAPVPPVPPVPPPPPGFMGRGPLPDQQPVYYYPGPPPSVPAPQMMYHHPPLEHMSNESRLPNLEPVIRQIDQTNFQRLQEIKSRNYSNHFIHQPPPIPQLPFSIPTFSDISEPSRRDRNGSLVDPLAKIPHEKDHSRIESNNMMLNPPKLESSLINLPNPLLRHSQRTNSDNTIHDQSMRMLAHQNNSISDSIKSNNSFSSSPTSKNLSLSSTSSGPSLFSPRSSFNSYRSSYGSMSSSISHLLNTDVAPKPWSRSISDNIEHKKPSIPINTGHSNDHKLDVIKLEKDECKDTEKDEEYEEEYEEDEEDDETDETDETVGNRNRSSTLVPNKTKPRSSTLVIDKPDKASKPITVSSLLDSSSSENDEKKFGVRKRVHSGSSNSSNEDANKRELDRKILNDEKKIVPHLSKVDKKRSKMD